VASASSLQYTTSRRLLEAKNPAGVGEAGGLMFLTGDQNKLTGGNCLFCRS
jgi:hypothetical protein